ncbi:MAG: SDR family oxidoreductase [bacterium]|jgi:NADP-dependent 3-hydroxy acid dehydrogenase YdfG
MSEAKKTILISGAGTGIGRATALAFSGAGWNVAGFGRRLEPLHSLEKQIERQGGRALVFQADSSSEEAVARLVEETVIGFGGLDAVFANSGTAKVARIEDASPADFRSQIESNVIGALVLIKAAIPHLEKNRGHIFVNTSISSRLSFPGWGAYSASKAALALFTRVLRKEMREKGIRVTEVIPGATATEIWDEVAPEISKRGMVAPESVASAILAAAMVPPEASVDEIKITPSKGNL